MSSPSPAAPIQDRSLSARSSPSVRARHRLSGSGVARSQARYPASRNANTQPSYDFLSGDVSSPPTMQTTMKASRAARPDNTNEEVRAQLRAVQYELSTIQQERQLVELRHEKELREVRKKAELDFKRAQASETDTHAAERRYEACAKELEEVREESRVRQTELEREVRIAQDQYRAVQEELEDVQGEVASRERQSQYHAKELEARLSAVQKTAEELQTDLADNLASLQMTQRQLAERETRVGELESEVLRLQAQTGDVDTLKVIKHDLSEQVGHIRRLETLNRDQHAEIKRYRTHHKSIEVVEEEKRALEGRLRILDDLTRELGEARLQRQILLDERQAWTSYLETQASSDGTVEFSSPEALAKGFVQERLEKASLLERLGALEPSLLEKEAIISSLEGSQNKLRSQLEKAHAGGSGDTRARLRLERQRVLAEKEVSYLRAQLRTFDAEETTFFQPEKLDTTRTQRITELESMVDAYRQELQTLNAEVAQRDTDIPSTKRPRSTKDDYPLEETSPADDDEHYSSSSSRYGSLLRKTRTLQHELSHQQQATALLRTTLTATETQLASLQSAARTRILALNANPTSAHTAIQFSRLDALQRENTALLAQVASGLSPTESIPLATLEPLRLALQAETTLVAEREKRMARLKQIWTAKSLEFREAIASVLGFKMDFMPNGRVRMTSLFFEVDDDNEDKDDGQTGEGNSIIFDGEQGTMKVGGGRDSRFRKEIEGLIRFWVEERKEIPCFLAAMTLEGYERRESRREALSA